MGLETDCKFLETTVQIFAGYHLLAAHRTPAVDAILFDLTAPNYRIMPYATFCPNSSKLGYILGIFSRIEANTTFHLQMSTCILETVVELRLHHWPMPIIRMAIDKRDKVRRDGVYRTARDVIRASTSAPQ